MFQNTQPALDAVMKSVTLILNHPYFIITFENTQPALKALNPLNGCLILDPLALSLIHPK